MLGQTSTALRGDDSETRTGIGTYRWGETRIVSVVHQLRVGERLMTSRVASGLVSNADESVTPVTAPRSTTPTTTVPDLAIRKPAKTSAFIPFFSLRSRLRFPSRHVSKRWGKALASGHCESGMRTSLFARFPQCFERERAQIGTVLFYMVAALAVRILDSRVGPSDITVRRWSWRTSTRYTIYSIL